MTWILYHIPESETKKEAYKQVKKFFPDMVEWSDEYVEKVAHDILYKPQDVDHMIISLLEFLPIPIRDTVDHEQRL